MTKLNIDIKDHKFRELLTYWRKVIVERLRRGQYYEDPRYGMLVLTRREFLKLLLSLGLAGAIATLGIGMFNAHWLWAQETTNPPPTPAQYNYGELNWLELTVRGTPLGEKLVAEYLFWEGTGTVLHDTSGNNNHATIYNARWWYFKNGKYFLNFSPNPAGQRPVAWVKAPHMPYNLSGYAFEIIYMPDELPDTWNVPAARWYDPWGAFLFHLSNYNGDTHRKHITCHLWSTSSGRTGYETSYTPELNKWHHVIVSFKREQYLYIEVNNIYYNFTPKDENLGNKAAPLYIGCKYDTSPYSFSGYITLFREFTGGISYEESEVLNRLAKIIIPELP